MEEKRRKEASALRNLIEDQLGSLNRLSQRYHRYVVKKEETLKAVESLVSEAAPSIRLITDYRDRLGTKARMLIDHIDQLSASLPEVIQFNQQSYKQSPLLRTLFYQPENMDQFFQHNPEFVRYIQTLDKSTTRFVYFMLISNIRNLTRLGVRQVNNSPQRDVLYTAIDMSAEHTYALADSETELKLSLKEWLYNQVVFELNLLIEQQKKDQIITAMKLMQPYDPNHEDPSTYLNILELALNNPSELVKLEHKEINTDQFGIKVSADDDNLSRSFSITELKIGKQEKQALILGCYSLPV